LFSSCLSFVCKFGNDLSLAILTKAWIEHLKSQQGKIKFL
jgi:hypothetical protein